MTQETRTSLPPTSYERSASHKDATNGIQTVKAGSRNLSGECGVESEGPILVTYVRLAPIPRPVRGST
ncbi:12278_t:CDS:2, partial [Acaulospora colombiana]